MGFRGWRWVAVVACGASFTTTSAAEPVTDERARLSGLLRTGADAAKGRDWKGCVNALWDALAIEDAARTAGDLALCEEQAGRFGDAMNHARRALAEATPDMTKKEPWKSYQAAVERLSSQVGLVMITADPPHARVIVDGRPFGKADGQLIAVSYGKHIIAARLEGYEDASETRVVAAGAVPHVRLELKPKAAASSAASSGGAPAVAPGPAAAPARPPEASMEAARPTSGNEADSRIPELCVPLRSVRGVLVPVACAGAAVFAVSAVTALGFELHARSYFNLLYARGFEASECAAGAGGAGAAECREVASRFRQRDDAANVMLGAGVAAGVLALSAGLAVAFEPKGAGVKVTAAPVASAGGGGLAVFGAW